MNPEPAELGPFLSSLQSAQAARKRRARRTEQDRVDAVFEEIAADLVENPMPEPSRWPWPIRAFGGVIRALDGIRRMW